MKLIELEFTDKEWNSIEGAAKYYQNWSDTITNDKGEVIANPVTTEDLFIRELNKHFSFYIESHAQAVIAQQAQNQSRKIEGKEKKK